MHSVKVVGMDPLMLSVVLPCYNEAPGLAAILRCFAEAGRGQNFEIILVDNGSTDETPTELGRLLPSYPFARSVRVEKNQGYGHGVLAGLQAARGEVLAWSHADLQTDPSDVFRALEVYRQAHGPQRLLVKGKRHGRRLGEWLVSRGMEFVAAVALRRWITEINAQPKLFHRDLLQHLVRPPMDFNFDVYVLYQALRHGWRVQSIDVQFPPRPFGQSHWATSFRSRVRNIRRSMLYMFGLGLGIHR